MFVIVYRFQVKPGHDQKFIQLWEAFTNLIYEHVQRLGSVLHHEFGGNYMAYAKWPNEATFASADQKLALQANEIQQQMRQVCSTVEVLHRLKEIKNLSHDNIL